MSAASAFFVLLNSDLVAVPLQLDRGGVLTVFCGERRARQLQSDSAQDNLVGVEYASGLMAITPASAGRMKRRGQQVEARDLATNGSLDVFAPANRRVSLLQPLVDSLGRDLASCGHAGNLVVQEVDGLLEC